MRNGGKIISIPTEDIVVGDIIQVNYGDILAADGVCIESMGLRLDESALTGESKELPKSPDGDLILLSPTNVVDGTGRMLAIAVGEKSQNGIICKKLGILEISEEEKNARKEAKKQAKIKQTTQNDNAETNKSDKDGKKEIKESEEPGDDEDFNSTGDNYKSVLQQKQENLSKILTYIAFIVATITIIVKLTLEILKVKEEFQGDKGSKEYSNRIFEAVLSSLQLALTIVVVAVPEGILIATTLTATIAAKRMKKDGCNVQFISACETMGNATVICSDKIGTLTQNKMTVMQIYIGDKLRQFDEFFDSDESSKNKKPQHMSEDYIKLLGRCIALNTNVTTTVVIEELTGDENKPQKKKSKKGVNLDFKEDHLEKNNEDKIIVQRRPRDRYVQNGNKTECALLGLCSDFGIDWKNIREEGQNRIVKMFAFNSARKCMSTVFEDDDGGLEIFIKGASEVILEKCSTIITEDGSTRSLDNSEKSAIKDKIILPMARNGLRTLSIGVKFASSEERNSVDLENESHLLTNMTLVTLVGIEDPVRPEVPACVSHVNNAGVRVIMVTGDNIETAKSIARQCHIYSVTVDQEHEDPTKNKEIAITSSQFNKYFLIINIFFARMIKDPNTNKFSQQKFDSIWPHLRVLARSQPEDKLTLVSGIINSQVSKHQEIVAVTGDGTNDALAIKKADVGFAMVKYESEF
ncbi:MAG: Plasma membrane calcium-transporting ATPase 3 [Paramarteilia canceri]